MRDKYSRFAGLIAVLCLCGCDEEKLSADFPQCPQGAMFDAASHRCVSDPVKACADGQLYDPATDDCLPNGNVEFYVNSNKYYCASEVDYEGELPYSYDNNMSAAALVSVKYANVKTIEFNADSSVQTVRDALLNRCYSGVSSKYYAEYRAETKKDENGSLQSVLDENGNTIKKWQLYTNKAETYWNSNDLKNGDRATMVYPETLRDGDVLIYSNKADNSKTNANSNASARSVLQLSDDDGTYAFLFYNGSFHLIENGMHRELLVKNTVDGYYGDVKEYCNKDKVQFVVHDCGDSRKYNGPNNMYEPLCKGDNYKNCKCQATIEDWYKKYGKKANNKYPVEIYCTSDQAKMLDRFGDLPSLYGKDFFVILRPSLLKTSK